MSSKQTIHVQLNDARPVRPAKTFGVMLLELRARLGAGGAAKFRSSLSRDSLKEVAPPHAKRVRS